MAATLTTNSAWSKPGAWALDSEQHDEQQQQNDAVSAAAAADFPSLSIAATTKPKKKKAQTKLSLAEFKSYDPSKVNNIDLTALPTGPRERTAEELERNKGFRSYGANSDSGSSRWGKDRESGRDSLNNKEFTPSRADENDDWGAGKRSGGFERRERSGFFENSQSRADGPENWGANKSLIEGRRRVGFEFGSGGGEDSENWGKKKEEEGRRFGGAFDSLRERRGGAGSFVDNGESWGKKEDVGNVRPKLNLQPRKVGVGEGEVNVSSSKGKGASPFGDARPREEVLKEKGQDWKEVDEKLESLKMKEKEAAGVVEGVGFRKRGFGIGSGRGGGSDERVSWRKNDALDVRPESAERVGENGHIVENGHASENGQAAENGSFTENGENENPEI